MIPIENLQKKIGKLTVSYGQIQEVGENVLVSKGPSCRIGDVCVVGEEKALCEVIGLKGQLVYLMSLSGKERIGIQDKVTLFKQEIKMVEPEKYLGRTINAMGEVMYGDKPVGINRALSLQGSAPDPMSRERIQHIFETGIRAIDGLLTIGRGQRMGIFAGTGVGKSTLLGMISQHAEADVNVIALIGERGREVREFIEKNLGEEGLRKSIVVVSTSDEQPLMTIKAAQLATSLAEHFRDEGKNVLLMMDSVTRFAMARREIDIAADRIPIGGKTPSMEPYLKGLLERAGTNDKGSITGIYTVLVEGDDMNGPIPDIVRGILDGHIVLTRELAALNHFPSIDVLKSKSRVMQDIVSEEHQNLSNEFIKYMELYAKNEETIKLGAIDLDRNPEIAKAFYLQTAISDYLRQGTREVEAFQEGLNKIETLIGSVRI